MIFWTTLFPQKWATWRISCALMLLDIDFLVRFLLFSSDYLEYLSISGNFFCGTVSFSLESLTSIKELDFSSNSLTSQIPKYLGNLSFLEFLIISYDYFEGEVPIKKEFLRIKIEFQFQFQFMNISYKWISIALLKVVIQVKVSFLILSVGFTIVYAWEGDLHISL